MNKEKIIRDLIYFDVEKTASLFSQVEGGILREITEGVEEEKDERNIRKYELGIFRPEFGGASNKKTSTLESRVIHHDLLVRTENYLFDNSFAVDINSVFKEKEVNGDSIRDALKDASYVRATGWAVIEDYGRLKNISKHFNHLTEFIGRCSAQSVTQSDEFKKIQKTLDNLRLDMTQTTEGKGKTQLAKKISQFEQKFNEELRKITGQQEVPGWLMSGMQMFIDIFMPGRINIMVYPFETIPDFRVLANLKKDCFVDADIENLLFAYGSNPNVKLSLFGLITSFPMKTEKIFDPMREFGTTGEVQGEAKSFEEGFRAVFRSMEGLEELVRFSRYPNISIHPIAVYRTIHSKKS